MATATTKKGKRKEIKVTPAVHVTLGLFDTREPWAYRVQRENVPIGDFKPVTSADYRPAGGTPLRDAVGKFVGHLDTLRTPSRVTIGLLLDESGSMAGQSMAVIEGVNQFVEGMRDVKAVDPESAGKVLAVIVTDGYENSSREIAPEALSQMIAQREADGWTFIYLGAGIDAWATGAELGFSGSASGQVVSTSPTVAGTRSAFASVTSDGVGYLGDNQSYLASRSGSALRSVAEDGAELDSNINASPATSNAAYNPPIASSNVSSANVEEALKRAKKR